VQDQLNIIFAGAGLTGTVTQGPPKTVSVTLTNPHRSLWISASSFSSDLTQCAIATEAVLNTGLPITWSTTCTDNDSGRMQTDIPMPGNWDGGTIKVRYYVYSTTSQSTVVAYSTSGQCVRSGDAVAAVATTGEVTTSLTFTSVANQEINGLSSAITLQGTCAAYAHVYLHTDVDATATTATMANVRFKGLRIEYGITGVGEAE
jgi:hypothetical protein